MKWFEHVERRCSGYTGAEYGAISEREKTKTTLKIHGCRRVCVTEEDAGEQTHVSAHTTGTGHRLLHERRTRIS